jgi:hypothetical protein
MGSLGVHFAITKEQEAALEALADDDEEAILAHVGAIEAAWDLAWLVESDKAWEAMHRALTDGELDLGGKEPLAKVIFGGLDLVSTDEDSVMLVRAQEVPAVAKALAGLGEAQFRERYFKLCKGYSAAFGEEDCQTTWENLAGVRELYRKAAAAGRAMLFTVSH